MTRFMNVKGVPVEVRNPCDKCGGELQMVTARFGTCPKCDAKEVEREVAGYEPDDVSDGKVVEPADSRDTEKIFVYLSQHKGRQTVRDNALNSGGWWADWGNLPPNAVVKRVYGLRFRKTTQQVFIPAGTPLEWLDNAEHNPVGKLVKTLQDAGVIA